MSNRRKKSNLTQDERYRLLYLALGETGFRLHHKRKEEMKKVQENQEKWDVVLGEDEDEVEAALQFIKEPL